MKDKGDSRPNVFKDRRATNKEHMLVDGREIVSDPCGKNFPAETSIRRPRGNNKWNNAGYFLFKAPLRQGEETGFCLVRS